jgi:hypothetical protein
MAKPPQNPAHLDGRAYLYSIQRHEKRILRLELGISICDTARFTLRREGALDRFAKWLGLAREWQTRDADFDQNVFVQSEDSRLHDALSCDAELRTGIRRLLTISTVFRLEMSNGVLQVHSSYDSVSHGRGSDAEIAEKFARRVLKHLSQVGARLVEISALWDNSRDPYLQRYRLLLGAGSALGIAGVVALLTRPGPDFPYALQRDHIYTHAAYTAAIASGVLVALVLALLGRTSRTHRLLACMIFVATPGVWGVASVYHEHRNNSGMEQRVESSAVVARVDREGTRRRRRYMAYFFHLEDARIPNPLRVDYQTYRSMPLCVYLDVRAGKLGDPWIAGIRPCEGL